MAKNWTVGEIKFLEENIHFSPIDVFSEYVLTYGAERSYDSIQKKLKQVKETWLALEHENDDGYEDHDELLEINENPSYVNFNTILAEPNTEERKVKKAEAKAWLEGLLEEYADYKPTTTQTVQTSNKTSLCLVLSDLHFGKQTESFNLAVAKERVLDFVVQAHQNAKPELDEIVLILAGDIVEGEDIFPTQNGKLECSALKQAQSATAAIWESIILAEKLFKIPVRVETVPGNHGRTSKTANVKSNWDNVVYFSLGLLAKQHNQPDKIVVNVNPEKFHLIKVKDKVGLITHYGVKHTGTPAMVAKIAGWANKKKFDFLVHGHWHEWHVGNWLGKLIVSNGCICGSDDFSEEIAKEDNARQAYFFITEGRPIWGFSFIEW